MHVSILRDCEVFVRSVKKEESDKIIGQFLEKIDVLQT